MNKTKELLNAIEEKRVEMHTLSETQPLNSEVVIKVSQELDVLLNQYQKLIDKNKK